MFRRCLLGKLIFIFQINLAFSTFEGEGERTGENKREGENKGSRVNSVISEKNNKQEKRQQIISEYLTFDPPPHLEDPQTSGNKFIKEAKHGSVFQFVSAKGKNATDLEKYSQILSNEIPKMEFSDLAHFDAVIPPRNKE